MINVVLSIGEILDSIKLYKLLRGEYRKRKKYYQVIWQKAHKIKSDDLSKLRKFRPYYYSRSADDIILECLERKKSILIVGKPLIGKTRAAFEACKKVSIPYIVTIARSVNINEKEEDFFFPRSLRYKKNKLVIVDDLHDFAVKQKFQLLIEHILKRNCVLLATCRSGFEFTKTKNVFTSTPYSFDVLFGENIIEIEKIKDEKAKKIAKKLNISWDKVGSRFDGTPGSILLQLLEMEKRFDNCSFEEKTILRSIKKMYECGIYEEKEIFSKALLKNVCQKEYDYEKLFEELQKKEFLELTKENVLAEKAYLETIVTFATKFTIFDLFEEMLEIFEKTPKALYKLGNKAHFTGLGGIDTEKHIIIAIRAYESAIDENTFEKSPLDYGKIKANIGNAYTTLADIGKGAENCWKAIGCIQDAFKVYTSENYPFDHAHLLNNLGNIYRKLAELDEDKDKKIEYRAMAIEFLLKTLQVFNLKNFPMNYGVSNLNLGAVYTSILKIELKVEIGKKALEKYIEALKVFTIEKFPKEYATTKYNIGVTYQALAKIVNKKENCKNAHRDYKESLKIFTEDKFPNNYKLVIKQIQELSDFCRE